MFGCRKVECVGEDLVRLDDMITLKMDVQVAASIVALRPCIEAMLVRSCINPESLMTATEQDRELCTLLRELSSPEFFAGGGPMKDALLTDAALVQPITAGRGRGGPRFAGPRGDRGGGGRGWRGGASFGGPEPNGFNGFDRRGGRGQWSGGGGGGPIRNIGWRGNRGGRGGYGGGGYRPYPPRGQRCAQLVTDLQGDMCAAEKEKPTAPKGTKVVLRRLPRDMTEAELMSKLGQIPPSIYTYFVPADKEMEPFAYSRCYFTFVKNSEVLEFSRKWNGFRFVDSNGNHSIAMVELTANDRIP
ncbi:unnamed protein product, partial [Strongylus vulgaris]